MGENTSANGFTNLPPHAGSVSDTNIVFTLPVGLNPGLYWVKVIKNNNEVAESLMQVGKPWLSNDCLPVGYNAATMSINQDASAFWQANDNLTVMIKKETASGQQVPPGFENPIINNTNVAKNALVIIQVRNGAGATAGGGGTVLASGGVETAIPSSGNSISCSFTLPSGVSGTAYVDVSVWDGWSNQVPLADPHQSLTFSVI